MPAPVPASDGLLDNRPALVAAQPPGSVYLVYAADGRNRAAGQPTRHALFVAPIAGSRGTAPEPSLVAEAAPGFQPERRTIEADRLFEIVNVEIDQQVHPGPPMPHVNMHGQIEPCLAPPCL